jgi:elongation factor Ts
MEIAAGTVKLLRDKTGAGIMDCKRALQAALGNPAEAEQILRNEGKFTKKEGPTFEGAIAAYTHHNGRIGALLELRCETDFVAKTKEFTELAYNLAMQVAAMKPNDMEHLLKQEFIRNSNVKVGDLISEFIVRMGENIQIGRYERLEL